MVGEGIVENYNSLALCFFSLLVLLPSGLFCAVLLLVHQLDIS